MVLNATRSYVSHHTRGGGTSGVPHHVLGTLAIPTQYLAHYPVHDALSNLTIIMLGADIIRSLSRSNNDIHISKFK